MITPLLLSALLLGAFGSGHCVAMCGPVAGLLGSAVVKLGRGPRSTASLFASYHVGRIASYALAGAIVGSIGTISERFALLDPFRGALKAFAGVIIVLLGLRVVGLFRATGGSSAVSALLAKVTPALRRLLPVRNGGSGLLLGLLWGLMPCGLSYAGLGIALGAGSATMGALSMMAFGVGTLPALLAVGALSTRGLELLRAPQLRKLAGAMVVVTGMATIVQAAVQTERARAGEASSCCTPH